MNKILLLYLPILLAIVEITILSFEFNSVSNPIYQQASAHFFGVPVLENKTAGGYKIVFQPYPTVPVANDNSTKINLSILDRDNQNINGVFSSLIIKEKDTGRVLKNFPYGFYEFSDMTFSYTFPRSGTYVLTLESKINGDPIYSQSPLLVDFELPVSGGYNYLTFTESVVSYLVVAAGVTVAVIIYFRMKSRQQKK